MSHLPVKFKRKIIKISRTHYVNMPKEILEHMNLQKGDTVSIYVLPNDELIVIEKESKTEE